MLRQKFFYLYHWTKHHNYKWHEWPAILYRYNPDIHTYRTVKNPLVNEKFGVFSFLFNLIVKISNNITYPSKLFTLVIQWFMKLFWNFFLHLVQEIQADVRFNLVSVLTSSNEEWILAKIRPFVKSSIMGIFSFIWEILMFLMVVWNLVKIAY